MSQCTSYTVSVLSFSNVVLHVIKILNRCEILGQIFWLSYIDFTFSLCPLAPTPLCLVPYGGEVAVLEHTLEWLLYNR